MKTFSHYLLLVFTILYCCCNVYAGDDKTAALKAQAKKILSSKNEAGFLENAGQMMDANGSPIPFVLFATQAAGLNFFITEKGITLQTLVMEEENEGEGDESENEMGGTLNEEEENIEIQWERIDVELKGANIKKENIVKENPLQGQNNYFYPHCPDGIYGVHEFQKVTIKEVYQGIDWVLYRKSDGELKYDFIVHPGADYKQIELLYKSKTPIKINRDGQLELTTRHGDIKENTPVSFLGGGALATNFIQNYQHSITINNDAGYETSIGFQIPNYFGAHTSDLVIDPALVWATWYGAAGATAHDGPNSVDTDASGNVFIGGYTVSTTFPTVNLAGSYFQAANAGGAADVIIMKITAAGVVQWATYYGGTGSEMANSLDVDNSGNVVLAGNTESTNFPVSAGAFQGANNSTTGGDVFIMKFSNTGVRSWATYYGGANRDYGYSITCDGSGNIFVTGETRSADFPVSAGAFQPALVIDLAPNGVDLFILKFNSAGARQWATYYGGSSTDWGLSVITNAAGDVFVTGMTVATNFPVLNLAGAYNQAANAGGQDAFILKFSSAGVRQWATLYGGTGDERGFSVILDSKEKLYVMGWTNSTDFPVQTGGGFYQSARGGGYDAFILKFSTAGARLWGTYYGGTDNEDPSWYDHLAVDGCNSVYMAIETRANNMPVQAYCAPGYQDNSQDVSQSSFNYDMGVIMFDSLTNRLWATYLGGNGHDKCAALATDASSSLYMVGEWTNGPTDATYPITNRAGAYNDATWNGADDGFITKFTNTSCACIVTLPIELLYFTATPNGDQVDLKWCTASETNNDYFTVERSSDGVNFHEIIVVKGGGTTSSKLCYSEIDHEPLSGVSYYRLKQTDYDGAFTYSDVVAVNMDAASGALYVSRNSNGNYLLNYSSLEQTQKSLSIEVYNNIGQSVFHENLINFNGTYSRELDLNFSKGVYVISVSTDVERVVRRVVAY